MVSIHDEAVVLTRYEYSETSQIIVLLTKEQGKVRAIAKGIKRSTKTRFAAGIDLLDVGHVVLSRRKERGDRLATVVEWKQTRSLFGLREKLFRIHAAQYAAEVTSRLTEDWDPHAALFDRLIATLLALADAPEPFEPLVDYQLGLLDEIGSLPRFDTCVRCGQDGEPTHFSSFEGGVVCGECESRLTEKHRVTQATVTLVGHRIAKLGVPCEPRAPSATSADAHVGPFRLLDYHITHLMGRESSLTAMLLPRRRGGPAGQAGER